MNNAELIEELNEEAAQNRVEGWPETADLLDRAIAALSAQTTHSVVDTPEYKLGLEAGQADYEYDWICPNCVSVFKCNGPHLSQPPTVDENHPEWSAFKWSAFIKWHDTHYAFAMNRAACWGAWLAASTQPAPAAELTDEEIEAAYTAKSEYPYNVEAVRAAIAADRALRKEPA